MEAHEFYRSPIEYDVHGEQVLLCYHIWTLKDQPLQYWGEQKTWWFTTPEFTVRHRRDGDPEQPTLHFHVSARIDWEENGVLHKMQVGHDPVMRVDEGG